MIFKNRKKNYPRYQTTHMRDFREAVENIAKKYPDRRALTYRRKPSDSDPISYTYAEGRDYVRNLGTEFVAMGMRGEKVAIIGEASPEWVFSYFALMAIGAVTVPIDKELPVSDIASIINTAKCEYMRNTNSFEIQLSIAIKLLFIAQH
jgi:long-chain acyl-CoA synthetase